MSGDRPRLYLNTPFMFEPDRFADDVARALDAGEVACVRLRLRGASQDELKYAIDTLRPVCHAREVALVVSDHFKLVPETGLDGVHFERTPDLQGQARSLLGTDAIVGVGCGASKHHGMIAGERGADYVSFGPIASSPFLANGSLANRELFDWWQEMIELPVVAEGGMTPRLAQELVGKADFIVACRSVWRHPDGPDAGVKDYLKAFERGPDPFKRRRDR